MSQSLLNQNVPSKKIPSFLKKENKGAFAAILISGLIVVVFAIYYIILGEESRKKNSLQLVIAVSKI